MTTAHVHELPGPAEARVITAVGVNSTWATGLQDGYLDATFQLCRQAPGVTDPSQSHAPCPPRSSRP